MTRQKQLLGYLFITPALVVVLAVSLYPLLYEVWLSLTDWYLLRNPVPVFHGLAGYQRMIEDPIIWRSLWNTVIWTVGTVAIEFLLGLLLALLLNRRTVINGVLSGLILLPWVTPSIVVAYTWRWLLDSDFGALHYVLESIGLAGQRTLLAEPTSALVILIVISAWKGTPFMVIALLAALKAIPDELYEAAAVDGATPFQRFWHITLPLIRTVSVTISLVLGILAFYSFDIVWIMTKGGPSGATNLIGVYLFRNFFERQELSYAATIGVASILLLFVSVVIYLRLLRQSDTAR
jgi:multiple sugar transport system permease protein